MYCEPYEVATLGVAYQHHVCFHFQTYRRLGIPVQQDLTRECLDALVRPYGIHVLDLGWDGKDLICRVSLDPATSISVAVGKLKGRVSKWLSQSGVALLGKRPLARGYLAHTVGDTTRMLVLNYLDKQARKHGYAARPRPPVLVRAFPENSAVASAVSGAHNVTRLCHHVVLVTRRRRGVFTQVEAARIVAVWQGMAAGCGFRLLKVSFVPDHVHLAVELHPATVPVAVAVTLMNAAQDLMVAEFAEVMIAHARGRLWQNRAYIGSFGDVSGRAVREIIRKWRGG